jgi:hypothetical protein
VAMLFPFAGEVDGVVLIADIESQYQIYTYDGLTLGIPFLLFIIIIIISACFFIYFCFRFV